MLSLPLRHNLAISRPAAMDSLWSGFIPYHVQHAVDGSRTGEFYATSINFNCMHTEGSSDTWWRVDLGNSKQIAAVAITNRDAGGQGMCHDQINPHKNLKPNSNYV